ncbi:MAG: hypothetical protein N3I35_06860 [Clostridia bacterium]|nr:hypothetical protein [Clostridia bacterium]
MHNKYLAAVFYILIGVVSLFLSFFVVFNFMFSDSGSTGERVATYIIAAAAYGIVGSAGGFIKPGSWKTASMLLILPVLVITFLYSVREIESVGLNIAYLITAIVFAFSGAYIGSWTKLRRK